MGNEKIVFSQSLFRSLSRKYSAPEKVQRLLRGFPYNFERHGITMRSALGTWIHKTCHCLEASALACAILEWQGFPPLVMSLESEDCIDHVVFVFKTRTGWGSVSRSKEEGLNGRAPVFKSLRQLAVSYYDPFVDDSGRMTGFGVANLDDSGSPWRHSSRHVWKMENFLIKLRHQSVRVPESRYQRAFARWKSTGASCDSKRYWW